MSQETIAAVATPPGRGGVGVLRVSGPLCREVARLVCGAAPAPRQVCYTALRDARGEILDRGLALYFPQPASFTGEDVLELHTHGSPMVLQLLLETLATLGVRPAQPGEFSLRAFLNGKLDLAQAEAVADLIDAASEQAARSASRVLEGQLSAAVDALGERLLSLRAWVEAAIDFPDDDVDPLEDERLAGELAALREEVASLRARCARGRLLREGLKVVIAGPPNAGKSSLMNALAGRDVAIVTPIAGTTRDLLREPLDLDGLRLELLDTAGLRASDEPVEQVGIARAREALAGADRVLYVVDATFVPAHGPALRGALLEDLPADVPITVVRNKIDLTGERAAVSSGAADAGTGARTAAAAPEAVVALSARTGQGLELLREHLRASVGFDVDAPDVMTARTRHVLALDEGLAHLAAAHERLRERSGELVAEELRAAHGALMAITGRVTTEDLLGAIFSRFCIGK